MSQNDAKRFKSNFENIGIPHATTPWVYWLDGPPTDCGVKLLGNHKILVALQNVINIVIFEKSVHIYQYT